MGRTRAGRSGHGRADHRCLDPASDCAVHRRRHVRFSATLDDARCDSRRDSDRARAGRTRCRRREQSAGIGSVNLHRPMDAVRELRRCVTELGFVGVRQLPWLWGLPPNDRRYFRVHARAVPGGARSIHERRRPPESPLRQQLPHDSTSEVRRPARLARTFGRGATALSLGKGRGNIPTLRRCRNGRVGLEHVVNL